MDRRQFLVGATAGAVAPLIAAPVSMPAAVVSPAVAVPLPPVWEVGTDGDMNWELLRATTKEAAMEAWLDEKGRCNGCAVGDCECYGTPEARRVKRLDDKLETTGPNEARRIAGWLGTCNRCDDSEVYDWRVLVNDEAVCDECMTLADWKTEDPEHYVELIDELLTDEYGPDLRHQEYW